VSGANGLELTFQAWEIASLLKEMRAEGRSVVTLSAPKSRANDPRSASKRLTADAIKMSWRATGKDLEKAEAVGNAELYVEPVQKTDKSGRKTLTAPRFDCRLFLRAAISPAIARHGGAKAVFESFSEERQARNPHHGRRRKWPPCLCARRRTSIESTLPVTPSSTKTIAME